MRGLLSTIRIFLLGKLMCQLLMSIQRAFAFDDVVELNSFSFQTKGPCPTATCGARCNQVVTCCPKPTFVPIQIWGCTPHGCCTSTQDGGTQSRGGGGKFQYRFPTFSISFCRERLSEVNALLFKVTATSEEDWWHGSLWLLIYTRRPPRTRNDSFHNLWLTISISILNTNALFSYKSYFQFVVYHHLLLYCIHPYCFVFVYHLN